MTRDPVSKALKVLGWLIEQPAESAGVREVAAALHMSPSGAHRVLSVLVEEGMLRQDPTTSRYPPRAFACVRDSRVTWRCIPLVTMASRNPHGSALVSRADMMLRTTPPTKARGR